MKKLSLSVVGLAFVSTVAAGRVEAQNPACTAGDVICADSNDANAGTGNPLAPVTSMLPAQGILAIGPTVPGGAPDANHLYGFYDGDAGNPDPFDGYLGVSTADLNKSLLGLVYATSGNFNRAGGNTPLLPAGTPPLPTLPNPPGLPGTIPPLSGLTGVSPLGDPPTILAPSTPNLSGVTGPLMSTLANAGR